MRSSSAAVRRARPRPSSWRRRDGESRSWRRSPSRGERCAESSFRRPAGRCCASSALRMPCWRTPARRSAASVCTQARPCSLPRCPRRAMRRDDGVGRWGASTSIRCCSSERRTVGAVVLQPWTVSAWRATSPASLHDRREGGIGIRAAAGARLALRARIVIAAHGSWEPGPLPTQQQHYPQRPSDLFGFKAHFRGARLPPGLMPLLVFPHGYGGMVQTGHDRVSLSCCIRRDALEQCRRTRGIAGASARAAEAVFAHIEDSCAGVREACSGATLEGAWLSAGPIRPGIRPFARERIFAVGNAAGEAHPIVAEGISMAIQSAWLLCELLGGAQGRHPGGRCARGARGDRARIRAAVGAAISSRASAPPRCSPICRCGRRPQGSIVALARRVPAVLTLGAQWSGKTRPAPSVGVA